EDENGRIVHERPSDGQELTLAVREIGAALEQFLAEASWQRLDETPAVGRVDGAIEIGARHPAVEAELEVALDAAGEQHRVLEDRSEEHTSELQSRFDIVCRLLLEKKNDIDPR